MTRKALERLLTKAAYDFFETRPDLFEYTAATKESKWNLAHHLSIEIHKYLKDLDCDVDVIKPGYGGRRPDIIFHKRGTHRFNFLVVEMKKDGTPRGMKADTDKITSHWFRTPLRYRFGAVIQPSERQDR